MKWRRHLRAALRNVLEQKQRYESALSTIGVAQLALDQKLRREVLRIELVLGEAL